MCACVCVDVFAPMRLSVDGVEGSCFLFVEGSCFHLFSLCLGVEGDQSHTGLGNLRLEFVGDRRWVGDRTIRKDCRLFHHQSGNSAAHDQRISGYGLGG